MGVTLTGWSLIGLLFCLILLKAYKDLTRQRWQDEQDIEALTKLNPEFVRNYAKKD